jgi:hypothetical protein
MADVEAVTVECDDRGFELHLIVGDDIRHGDDGRIVLNIQAVAEDLWDEMVAKVGPWVLEKAAARRDYERARERVEDEGPWPGENPMDYYQRTGDSEPLREQADLLRDRAKTD